MDRAIPEAAKAAIGRQMAEAEQRRTLLLAGIDGLREQATADTEGLAEAVRQAFDEARQGLATATTPAEFNRFVDEFVGPMTIQADGTILQKQTPPDESEGHLHEYIAGGGIRSPDLYSFYRLIVERR